jgi:antitoxin CptB
MLDNSQEIMRKRLLWRATHRGIKEMDLIAGGFAAARLPSMDNAQLQEFAGLLEIPDHDLLSWATQQAGIPDDVTSPLLRELVAFRPDILK